MEYGHLHRVVLEQRAGHSYVAFAYMQDFRANCERQRAGQGTALSPVLYRTTVQATPEIVLAINQGNAQFLRADDAARDARWELFAFIKAAEHEDERWVTIGDDLRRRAAIPFCTF